MDIIYTDTNRIESGILTDEFSLDIDIGNTNDFQITTAIKNNATLNNGCFFYIEGTEYGGKISAKQVDTSANQIIWEGDTFRGMLSNKVIQPNAGSDYYLASGDLNTIIQTLISRCTLTKDFTVDTSETTVSVTNYQFYRYCTLLEGIEKLCNDYGYKLNISIAEGKGVLKAVPVIDYSDTVEFSDNGNVNYKIAEDNKQVNHLICLGKGELKDREVIHLYLNNQKKIVTTQYYKNSDEIAQIYDFSSSENLRSDGIKKFNELINVTSMELTIAGVDVEYKDIVGGQDYTTGIYIKKPITNKIIQIENDVMNISYKIGEEGEEQVEY